MKPGALCSRRAVAAVVLAASCLFWSACQRSAQYKRDEEYPRADQSPSYYGGGNQAATPQKIETLGQPKKRVIVLDFWNDTPVRQSDIGSFAADELRRGLFTTRRVIIPTDIKLDRTTEDFIQGEKVRVAQLVREGRRMGVAVLVIGRVSKLVYRQRGDEVGLLRQKQSLAAAEVELKIFDVGAGREIMAASKSGEATANTVGAADDDESSAANADQPEAKNSTRAELLKTAVREAANRLVPEVLKSIEKMAWEGRVAKVSGNRVYVNAGRASGLVAGDILKVLTPGDDVYDPSSGAFLGRSQGQLKGTLEVIDFLGPDGAVSEIHTGGNFQEGDVVQLY